MDSQEALSLPIELQRSQDFWVLVVEQLQGVMIPHSSLARQVGVGFLHLSLEHFYAILTLIQDKQFASAFSLMRPQYEAAIRGAWFIFCASDSRTQAFLDDRALPKIGAQIDDLQVARPEMEGLKDVHAGSWEWLNDYTHGGSTQIKSRFQNGQIECAITDIHAATCLSQARRFGIVVAVWFGDVANRDDVSAAFYQHLLQHDRE